MEISWNDALQGVAPITGGQALPPATYRLRAVGGEGRMTSGSNLRFELQFEVVSGPLQGRKAFHGENMPKGNSDNDKTRMGYFLGLLAAFGLTGEQLGQMFAGRQIDEQSLTYLAQMLVQSGRVVKGDCVPQKDDASRRNWRNWTPDDGIEPEPPKIQQSAPPQHVGPPSSPNGFAAPSGPPAGLPQGGFPAGPPQTVAAQSGLPLGGFPGSGGVQPVQGQAPQQFGGPGQFAPAAQPQAAGMNQFAQPQAAQFPAQQPAPQQDAFPGQQFPGQVNPANFPPQNPQQGFQPPAGLPGGTPPQANI